MVGSYKPAIHRPLLPSRVAKSWPVFIPRSCSGNGWRSPAAGYNYLQRHHSVPTSLQRATIRGTTAPTSKVFGKLWSPHGLTYNYSVKEQIKVYHFLSKEAWEGQVFLRCNNLEARPLSQKVTDMYSNPSLSLVVIHIHLWLSDTGSCVFS